MRFIASLSALLLRASASISGIDPIKASSSKPQPARPSTGAPLELPKAEVTFLDTQTVLVLEKSSNDATANASFVAVMVNKSSVQATLCFVLQLQSDKGKRVRAT